MEYLDNIIFIDKQIAIFGTLEEKFYLYDIRQENQINDSINIIDFSKLHLQVYNNTHYILFNMQNEEASLVEIGFEINITNKLEFTKCLLIAENWISKAEVKVIIQQEEFNNIQNKKNIIIISISLIFILIVCLIFILRRQQLKNQQLKQFQSISFDQSKIE
ncbi:unnamed protein product [Paramecium primaurelia]|uniref:Transmembrane protein n=1 Tax=Paramecium primaurelia TaxID=5886 RepID=A0A8S1QSK3_PARPR|nr:unnamed protein product [Paramecium primaurelia]